MEIENWLGGSKYSRTYLMSVLYRELVDKATHLPEVLTAWQQ